MDTMGSHAGWFAVLAGALTVAAVGVGVARVHRRLSPAGEIVDPDRWPADRASLSLLAPAFPASFGVARVVIDPGHGAPGNRGNTSCFCADEQDTTLALAEALRARLEATGHFEVWLSRPRGALVEYPDRVADAQALDAEAFVSLHSDIRGKSETWSPVPGKTCSVAYDAPGFAVLFSDEADPALVGRRRALGRAVARRMEEAGFLPYGGAAYTGLYEAEPGARGLFADRHAPEQRIFVLRRTPMPAVLVETHNALDPREATRWEAQETVDAFAAAVTTALVDALVTTR
jgi:N-acetylmuramoyl-L-alanine amidase